MGAILIETVHGPVRSSSMAVLAGLSPGALSTLAAATWFLSDESDVLAAACLSLIMGLHLHFAMHSHSTDRKSHTRDAATDG
ncbi:hypothetical protein V6N12_038757 [Hibiscus sabdariffa]|uniref:Uncharacterized protein n=1 Tax=Hibiscus sabdariffa TaxID=183260 RepID=A0ABR2CAR4_9ROSI